MRPIIIIYYSSKKCWYMVFVIAEIGVNWDGNFETAKNMIKNAKISGCDAVKFQSFNEEIIKNHPQKSRLIKSSISKNNIEIINELAKEIRIEWFCTPMTIDAIELLNPFVKRFKIREYDGRKLVENKMTDLFENLLKTEKQIMISTEKSPINCKFFKHPQVEWLYCVPKYPCNINDLDFKNIKEFHGFSNHCCEIAAPLTATILGANIIEIHITSDKSKDFFDNDVSFEYTELNELVRLIRCFEKLAMES